MKIAVFGTGRFYQDYKEHLHKFDIEYVIDNDEKKQGQMIDGRVISAPGEVDYSVCDFVVILVKRYERIKEQLVELGVAESKILPYFDIGERLYEYIPVITARGEIAYKDWVENAGTNKIMLISHELSRTGVPIALMHLAILLKNNGYNVLYTSMRSGNLSEELKERGIDYIEDLAIFCNSNEFLNYTKKIDFFIPGTACLHSSAPIFSSFNKPILWWMHETNKELLKFWEEYKEISNIHFYCGGTRVIKELRECAGIEDAKELLYFLPDIQEGVEKGKKHIGQSIIRFALLGTICERKAQDILGEATKLISEKYKGKYIVTFVGATFNQEQQEYDEMLREKYPNICYKGEMTQEELNEYYDEIDVLVCPSRDDPMPIVVTQAMQHGIPCIVSDEVGQAEYIQHNINGYVFSNENFRELASIMESILENPSQLESVGHQGKLVFEQHFSESSMRENIKRILEELMGVE